jgi:2,4-dienoyl-CoA reductase (NADPH2)
MEKEAHPGGQLHLAASVANRAELGDLVRNQLTACRVNGVEIRLSTEATVDRIFAEHPEVIVIATGADPDRPYWVPADLSSGELEFADVRDVLSGSASPKGSVLVIDELGFHQATSVAELLCDRGCTVEIATPGMVVGQDLGITLDLENWNVRAALKGIVQSTDLVATSIEGNVVNLLHHPTGNMVQRTVQWVVLSVPQRPADALYFAIRRANPSIEVHRVGDCVAPRRAHSAVVEGERVGASL